MYPVNVQNPHKKKGRRIRQRKPKEKVVEKKEAAGEEVIMLDQVLKRNSSGAQGKKCCYPYGNLTDKNKENWHARKRHSKNSS